MGLLYDTAALAGCAGELAYWELRTRGVTDADIRGAIVLGCGAAAFAAFPVARESSFAGVFMLPSLERASVWLHRQGWWKMTRIGVLFSVILFQVFTLVRTAPMLFAPSYVMQAQLADPTRELSNHGTRLDALREWQRDMDSQKFPERIAIIEKAILRIEESQKFHAQLLWGAILPGLAWGIQQIFKMLMRQTGKEE